jgi:hypothetical protein
MRKFLTRPSCRNTSTAAEQLITTLDTRIPRRSDYGPATPDEMGI